MVLATLLNKAALRLVYATYGDNLRRDRSKEGGSRNGRGRDKVHTRYLLPTFLCRPMHNSGHALRVKNFLPDTQLRKAVTRVMRPPPSP
jgi:hypothetical protein